VIPDEQPAAGPYAQAALSYRAAGWLGVLPLPPRAKYPPPGDYTGRSGLTPSGADIYEWLDGPTAAGNIALRLPVDCLGLDVDAYAGKMGAVALAEKQARWEVLPDTWRSTSRDDGLSGIRFYRVPVGLLWPSELGSGAEIIQAAHRYAVVWPSIHPEGGTYRWIDPDGVVSLSIPRPDDLPDLPSSWVTGLSRGEFAKEFTQPESITPVDVLAWMSWPNNAGPACPKMQWSIDRGIASFGIGSRHDAGCSAIMHLAYLSAEGHRGAVTGLSAIWPAWLAAVSSGANVRSSAVATSEWGRMLGGAVAVLRREGRGTPPGYADPCERPLGELLGPLAGTTDGPQPMAADVDPFAVHQELQRQQTRELARRILVEREAARTFREPPSVANGAEYLAIIDEPLTFRIEDVMPTGANVLLTAQYKTGKTTLVNHAVKCLVDGSAFLGRYPVSIPGGRVAIWNYEVSPAQYRRWLRGIGIGEADRFAPLDLRGYRVALGTGYGERWAIRWLSEREASVWIVDPFARAFLGSGDNENDNGQVGHFLEILDAVKEQAGISELIMPTHTGRAAMDVGSERARGATRLDDWADVRWLLTRGTGEDIDNRYFRATGRDVETDEGVLEYNPLTRGLALVDGAPREVEVKKAGPGRGRAKRNIQNVIMEILREHGPLKLGTLKQLVGADNTSETWRGWLAGLAGAGMITIREEGVAKIITAVDKGCG